MALGLASRFTRLGHNAVPVLQSGLAAGLAWWVAHDLVGHHGPFFAPIAAVITLGIALGQRLRRTVELIVGVALGIAVGDALILVIGTGPVQIGAVVILAMAAAILLRGGPLLIGQAASSAVLVATLAPPTNGVYYSRWIDTLVGGGVGFAVNALLLPVNPLTPVHRTAAPVFAGFADALDTLASALRAQDQDAATGALEKLRDLEAVYAVFHDTVTAGTETVAVAPARWRSRRPIAAYARAARHLDLSIRNARVVARRAARALGEHEPIPTQLPAGLATFAEAVRWLGRELADGVEPEAARARALSGIRELAAATGGVGFSGRVVQAQARTVGFDLLRASGLTVEEADRGVRKAWEN